jgi:hypothetical protein
MMTDNGLAPLAAALAARHRGKHERIEQGPDEHNLHAAVIPEPCDAERHREEAAAILAALPDDWCGHAAEALDREAFIGRQWAEIARLRAALAKLVEAASTPPPMQAHDWSILQGALKEARLALAGS